MAKRKASKSFPRACGGAFIGNIDKLCVESVHLYDESPPSYPKKKRRK